MNKEWVIATLKQEEQSATNYLEKAHAFVLQELVEELQQRIEMGQAELDGTVWSRKNW